MAVYLKFFSDNKYPNANHSHTKFHQKFLNYLKPLDEIILVTPSC